MIRCIRWSHGSRVQLASTVCWRKRSISGWECRLPGWGGEGRSTSNHLRLNTNTPFLGAFLRSPRDWLRRYVSDFGCLFVDWPVTYMNSTQRQFLRRFHRHFLTSLQPWSSMFLCWMRLIFKLTNESDELFRKKLAMIQFLSQKRKFSRSRQNFSNSYNTWVVVSQVFGVYFWASWQLNV